jgi:hypothetical protein
MKTLAPYPHAKKAQEYDLAMAFSAKNFDALAAYVDFTQKMNDLAKDILSKASSGGEITKEDIGALKILSDTFKDVVPYHAGKKPQQIDVNHTSQIVLQRVDLRSEKKVEMPTCLPILEMQVEPEPEPDSDDE